jgi:tetratricopeptide (TPR) repeat protein
MVRSSYRRARSVLVGLAAVGSAFAAPCEAPAANLVERAAGLIEQERFFEAESALRRVLAADPRSREAIYYLGRVYLETGRVSEAVRFLEREAARHPGSSRIHQGLGEANAVAALDASLFRQVGLARASRQALERAVVLDPGNVEARVSLFEFYRHAPAAVGGGRERALAQEREIGRREPSRGHELRANLLRDEGLEREAMAEYGKAIASDPGNLSARLALALLHTELREFDRALSVLDRILARDPDHSSALYQVGRNAALSGRQLERGEEALRRYLRHRPRRNQPSHAWAHYRLGMIHNRRGEVATARSALRTALRLDPGLEGARKALTDLGS